MVQTPHLPRGAHAPGHSADKRREILDAAARVFRRRGLHATGMRDIAAELGMAVGILYYYFRDKEELLGFVQQDALTGLLALAERVRGLEISPQTKLYLLLVGHVVRLNEGTPGSLAHLEAEALGERWRQALQTHRDAYELCFREIIESGVRTGLLRPVDAKVTAFAMLGAVNWTVKWFRPEGKASASEIGGQMAELLVRGVLAPGVSLSPPSTGLLAEIQACAVAVPVAPGPGGPEAPGPVEPVEQDQSAGSGELAGDAALAGTVGATPEEP